MKQWALRSEPRALATAHGLVVPAYALRTNLVFDRLSRRAPQRSLQVPALGFGCSSWADVLEAEGMRLYSQRFESW